ncbi:hypothetical protein IGL98_003311 [Enterococcus sp. DIV0840]|uniref:helix-turn-helix domain-containing protein n=1 Tax=unclassified Enterococcus TaxID=2608891 RepID=UPI001A8CB328|nr:helix-turn-helix domain-containing protein [Enterococcus sp. DIV0849a]MBO0435484.1 helix-turn-helix domain-containing protein [Enterococcus sp. DIV0849a]
MEYLDFLDDEDHDKLKLLMTLQLYNDQYLTQKRLIELTGLSKFLLEKYITELNVECPELSISEEIYDELFYPPISNDIIQKVQHDYAQRSLKFRFFIEVLVEEKTIKKFQEEQHIAKTTLYQIRNKVLSYLKKERIAVQKNRLTGDEMKVRSIIFDLVSYFFFGEEYPFSKESDQAVQQLLQLLTTHFRLDLTFFQKKKLALFIHIIYVRIKKYHELRENLCSINEKMQQSMEQQMIMIEQALYSTKEARPENFKESNYLLAFLFVSDMFTTELTFNQELFIQNQNAAQELTERLASQFQVTDRQKEQLYNSFLKKLLSLSIFKQGYTTFVETAAYSYFAEVYYPIHKLILRFIRKNHFLLSLELSKNDQAKLYYDIMFSVLSLLEPSQLGQPINIYIDFSHGIAYTEYICQSLRRFRDLNVRIQEKFNNETHVFLSDYRLHEASCRQIIWKQPPTSSDWAKFADLVIELREVENEKNHVF